MITDIAIVGAGGLGKEFSVIIRQINKIEHKWNILGFYDDELLKGQSVAGYPILGSLKDLENEKSHLAVVIAIGDPVVKRNVVVRLQNPNLSFPSLIHPECTIGEQIAMGRGCVLAVGCRLSIDISLGDFVLLNGNVTVGHDVAIGSFSSVMPGVHLSGFVKLEEAVMIGTGASILQNITIGKYAKVGAGAVVTHHVAENTISVGVPAKTIKK